MYDPVVTLSRNVEWLRQRTGWDWKRISKKSGVNISTLMRIRQMHNVNISTVDAIAGVFGLSAWQLLKPLGGDDDVRPV